MTNLNQYLLILGSSLGSSVESSPKIVSIEEKITEKIIEKLSESKDKKEEEKEEEEESEKEEQEEESEKEEVNTKPSTTPFKGIIISKSKTAPKKVVKFPEEKEPKIDIESVNPKEKTSVKIMTKTKPTTEGSVLKRDITGMSLSNPNPFENRLKKRVPKLFTYDLNANYKGYNRICPSNVRRQPVILNDAEKEKIDRDHPGSYQHAIHYGIPGGEKYWYICPRYWSLKDNTSLTEEEVKSGKYGNVIPFKGPDGKPIKSVPPNASIFEFNAPAEHEGKKGEYIQHYPGFVKSESHPSGYCLPCCFKQWDNKEQQKRREECMGKQDDVDLQQKELKEGSDDYIKGADKFPIQQKRMGFLPLVIQRFLKSDNQKCQVSATNTSLKKDYVCLLRQGVEINRNKSFIACIADIYGNVVKKTVPRVDEMQQILVDSLNIDIFSSLQNGSLIETFGDIKEVDLDEFKESILYKASDLENPSQKETLIKIASAFNNFKEFLLSKDELIDYTYLWDLVCKENPYLFSSGLNLIIIEVLGNDITDNVNIICPTNHFSNQYFDVNKKTLLLIKNDNFYEPIYAFEDKKNIIEVTRLFSLNSDDILPDLKETLLTIRSLINQNCTPLPSLPEVYKFKQNISLLEIVKILNNTNYDIINQVLNYNGKVIGLVLQSPVTKDNFYVPCYPSNILIDLDREVIWIDDVKETPYQKTKQLLEQLSVDTNRKILCLPEIKVIDEELIVGIITETNQFVSVIPEANTIDDNLEILEQSDFLIADKESLVSKTKDIQREEYIKNIKLEKNFYNSFRNTIRILLGNPENSEIRQQLENLVNNEFLLYFKKIEDVEKLLKELTSNSIQFILYTDALKSKLDEVSSCIVKDEAKCKSDNYCLFSEGDVCNLLIPKDNLLTGKDNEKHYFERISDELIRYNRIRNFIFEPQTFLSFSSVKYNLRDNELLIIQSLLNQDFFVDLIPINNSDFVDTVSYDNINPDMSVKYASVIDITKDDTSQEESIDNKFLKKNKTATKKPILKVVTQPQESAIKTIITDDLPDELADSSTEEDELEEDVKKEQKSEQKLEELQQEEELAQELEELEELEEEVEEAIEEGPLTFIDCKKEQKVLTSKWQQVFVKGVKQINYSIHSPFCSFQLIIEIITTFDNKIKINSINHLKEILINLYSEYKLEIFRIGNIWKLQGKKQLGDKLLLGEINIENAIMNETYSISNLDIILLSKYYKLPIILLSVTKLNENNKTFLVTNKSETEDYFFILVAPIKSDSIQEYRTFTYDKELLINLKRINLPIKTDIKIASSFDLDEYMKVRKPIKLKIKKPVPKPEDDEELDEDELLKALEALENEDVPKIVRPVSR